MVADFQGAAEFKWQRSLSGSGLSGGEAEWKRESNGSVAVVGEVRR